MSISSRELRGAAAIVWTVISTILILAVLTPFVLPASRVYNMFPPCEARLRGEPCILCGMTTAYVMLASGDVGAALEANRYSVALWSASILNFVALKAYLLTGLLRKRSPGGGPD